MGRDVQIKATMNTPITDAVQAAIIFAQPVPDDLNKFCRALDRLAVELTDQDKERGNPNLAAAARILADEVVRLRKELNTNKTIIEHELNTVLSYCCEAKAVVAGKPGSTQWYVCPECCEPCEVFRTTTQQPQ